MAGGSVKIVGISDTHNRHNKITVPACDLLIHAGDWSFQGKKSEVENFAEWLNKQVQCKEIVLIPGNHEKFFEEYLPDSLEWFTKLCPRAHLLIDQSIEVLGIKIYGSPAQPFFCDWAWNRAVSDKAEVMRVGYMKEKLVQPIKPHWDAIKEDTQILITHGPPQGILDQTTYANGDLRPEPLGCPLLMKRIKELKKLDLHFFGHIHHPGGTAKCQDGVTFYNASICDEMYVPSNPITIVEYDPTEKKPKPKKERRSVKNEYFKLKHAITDAIIAQEERLEESKKTLSTTTYMTPVQAVDSTIAELEKLRSYIRNVMLYKK
jgi:Icc-related predicted phosphoesterase